MKLSRLMCRVVVLASLVGGKPLVAAVGLEWRPAVQTANVGDVVQLGLYAVCDMPGGQGVSALGALLQWDPAHLQLLGVSSSGAYSWLQSGFPNDSGLDGLNNTWADGTAKYEALARFGNPAIATPNGLLVTSVQWRALLPASDSVLSVPPVLGQWSRTQVFGADYPNHDITGSLGQAVITVVPEPSALAALVGAILLSFRRARPG